jgi:hypothetical protein
VRIDPARWKRPQPSPPWALLDAIARSPHITRCEIGGHSMYRGGGRVLAFPLYYLHCGLPPTSLARHTCLLPDHPVNHPRVAYAQSRLLVAPHCPRRTPNTLHCL